MSNTTDAAEILAAGAVIAKREARKAKSRDAHRKACK